MSAPSLERLAQAWRMASLAHAGQAYAGHEEGLRYDYLTHLGLVWMEVCASLRAHALPASEDELAQLCAVLHDIVEDTPTKPEAIGTAFGLAVAQGVEALTKDASLPKAQQMADSLRRIRLQPMAVWRVKLADRIVNLSPPPSYWDQAKCRAYREEAGAILDALGDACPHLAGRLAEKIEAYRFFCQ